MREIIIFIKYFVVSSRQSHKFPYHCHLFGSKFHNKIRNEIKTGVEFNGVLLYHPSEGILSIASAVLGIMMQNKMLKLCMRVHLVIT